MTTTTCLILWIPTGTTYVPPAPPDARSPAVEEPAAPGLEGGEVEVGDVAALCSGEPEQAAVPRPSRAAAASPNTFLPSTPTSIGAGRVRCPSRWRRGPGSVLGLTQTRQPTATSTAGGAQRFVGAGWPAEADPCPVSAYLD